MSKIYPTRHQANKDKRGGEMVVKVDGGDGKPGYVIMTFQEYNIWRKQK